MEIINCLDTSSFSTSKPHSLFKQKSPALQHFQTYGSYYDPNPEKVRHSSVLKDCISKASGRVLYIEREIKSVLQYARLVPILGLFIAAPFGIQKLITYNDSFARKVDLRDNLFTQQEYIDMAMEEYAFDSVTYFDADGNVHTENGEQVEKGSLYKKIISFQDYTVKNGDTISSISQKFGLSNISTIIAINGVNNARSLHVGQKLTIPSIDGMYHEVSSRDTIEGIAEKYNVRLEEILDTNDLTTKEITEGQKIFIPGAKLSSYDLQRKMGEIFVKPIKTRAIISSPFGPRKDPISGVQSSHTGVDFACPTGTPVFASTGGKVSFTGSSPIYGNYIILKHADGYQTLYAHLSKVLIKKGDVVDQQTRIGLVGNTGYSTGAHLHFSVYKNSKLVDPMTVLK